VREQEIQPARRARPREQFQANDQPQRKAERKISAGIPVSEKRAPTRRPGVLTDKSLNPKDLHSKPENSAGAPNPVSEKRAFSALRSNSAFKTG
jgi:hypothetical protein